jgi:hypothetical protein
VISGGNVEPDLLAKVLSDATVENARTTATR